MAATHSSIACRDCGNSIDALNDTAGRLAPCPNCGGHKRICYAAMSGMRPSNYMLDHYVAHKLSFLTECGAMEFSENSTWLNGFILNSIFRVQLTPKLRAYLFNFLRRAEGAILAYRDARLSIIEHLSSPQSVMSPYFRALAHLEICVSQCYQGYELLASATGRKLFDPSDNSVEEKLQIVYVDSKHMDRMIHGEKLPPEATAGIWITNFGIESSRGALTFVELYDLLNNMRNLAERLSNMDAHTSP